MASSTLIRKVVTTRTLEPKLRAYCNRWGATKRCFVSLPVSGKLRASAKAHLLFVLAWEDATDEILRAIRRQPAATKRFLLIGWNLPAEAIVERISKLNVRDPHRLHVASVSNESQHDALISRVALACKRSGRRPAVFDAWVEPDELVAISPAFERLRVPLDRLRESVPGMGELTNEELAKFEVGADGAYIHWTVADAHLSWEALQRLVDRRAQLAALEERASSWALYGAAVRHLREERGLFQSDVTGLTERHLRRIEMGDQRLTSKAVDALATAHGLEPQRYLDAFARVLSQLDPAARAQAL